MTASLSLIVLRCSALGASLRFYERLGLSFTEEKHGVGPVHYSARAGHVLLELYPAGGRAGTVRLQLSLPSAQYLNLEEATSPSSSSTGFVLEDPDKNQIEVCRMIGNARELAMSPSVPAVSDHPFELWLEFEHWISPPDEDLTDGFFNMLIGLPDGTKYAVNVWTYKMLESARREAAQQGESLFGRYLDAPDLFVERMDRSLLEAVVADMIASGRLRDSWRVAPESKAS
ncbi:hypothetical protein BE21_50570 [Sorangium cellulosum]|uniref:VOC domain-containing protein n=1 Tax=Sorangium cellulosum TaxID=56 RepID=A0A150TG77_SORCE|nr:hypothetical protein BE21_50570 [Sorangium cellulosum]